MDLTIAKQWLNSLSEEPVIPYSEPWYPMNATNDQWRRQQFVEQCQLNPESTACQRSMLSQLNFEVMVENYHLLRELFSMPGYSSDAKSLIKRKVIDRVDEIFKNLTDKVLEVFQSPWTLSVPLSPYLQYQYFQNKSIFNLEQRRGDFGIYYFPISVKSELLNLVSPIQVPDPIITPFNIISTLKLFFPNRLDRFKGVEEKLLKLLEKEKKEREKKEAEKEKKGETLEKRGGGPKGFEYQ